MTEDKKKGLFDKAIDALTNRDEKAAAVAAEEKRIADEKMKANAARAKVAAVAKAKGDAAAKAKADAAEKAKLAATQKERQDSMARLKVEQDVKMASKRAEIEKQREVDAAAKEAAAKAAVVKHVWTNQDTYAELAFKHYGSMKEAYWRLIYDHNKEIIGAHPNNIKTGTEIEIPPLPEELKNK